MRVGEPTNLDDQELYEWSQDDLQAFYTALDCMDEMLTKAGIPDAEIADVIASYQEQKRSQLVAPDKVLDRIHNAVERRIV